MDEKAQQLAAMADVAVVCGGFAVTTFMQVCYAPHLMVLALVSGSESEISSPSGPVDVARFPSTRPSGPHHSVRVHNTDCHRRPAVLRGALFLAYQRLSTHNHVSALCAVQIYLFDL